MSGPVPLAINALREGRPEQAADLLADVVTREELDDPELVDVSARLWSLYAQALLGCDRPSEASTWIRKALRAARRAGEPDGVAAVRELQGQIVARQAEAEAARRRQQEREHIAATPLDALLIAVTNDADRAAVYGKKAAAERDAGRQEHASELFEQAIALADASGSVREQVFSRLGLASVHDARANVLAAQQIAESAKDFTLLATIAREAETLGVVLPHIAGPSGLRTDA